MTKKNEKRGAINPWLITGAAILGFFILRFSLVNRFMFFLILIAAAFGALGYILYKLITDFQERKNFRETSKGRLDQRVEHCKDQITRLKFELQSIETSIRELETDQQKPGLNNDGTIAHLTTLLRSFSNEKALREVKIKFYETCIEKLDSLLHHKKLVEQLAEKTQQLKQLRENQYEELADMEAFKTQLAYEEGFFETMDELSLRIQKTESLSESEILQKELEVMTKEIYS